MNTTDKIRKLLALSSSSNEHEAALALQKAQELALKAGISISDIGEDNKDVIESKIEEGTFDVSPLRRNLAAVLASHFRVETYISKPISSGSRIVVVGIGDDVQNFIEIFEWTFRIFKTLFLENLKKIKKERNYKFGRADSLLFQNTYFYGFCKGIDDALYHNETRYSLIVTTPSLVKQKMASLNLRSKPQP